VNPIEQVWGNLKSTELANLCSDNIGEVEAITDDGLWRIDADLCFSHTYRPTPMTAISSRQSSKALSVTARTRQIRDKSVGDRIVDQCQHGDNRSVRHASPDGVSSLGTQRQMASGW
jgi:hypothetical protein